ncbi:MAG: bifunctional riboflavin kinase/FAD synthetase [Bdellovibrio sp.]|nr:bifunctional riboflavin kinase/FAD synthetase [Bdellovibrio sp.]
MELVSGHNNILKKAFPSTVVTIGNFDGVHLGHSQIIKDMIAKAKSQGGTSIVYTFRPHPFYVLRPERHLPLLTTYDQRNKLLSELGVDVVIEEPFSREFSNLTAERFFYEILLHKINVKEIVVGYDFSFGKEREGHLENLRSFCKKTKVSLDIVSPLMVNEDVVSSTQIRNYLIKGEIERANRLLGREFFYEGNVIKGVGRGHQIGFPTANLRPESVSCQLLLANGVYATKTRVIPRVGSKVKNDLFQSITNIGVRPTFRSNEKALPPVLIETYLLDMDIDLYGAEIQVCFVKKLRDEKRFSGLEELKKQIEKDIQAAR